MKCNKCKKEFEEKDLHESHDVPAYLWEGNRKGRKNQADKWGRHWLCKDCHDKYEHDLRIHLRNHAWTFAILYFIDLNEKEVEKNGNSKDITE